MDLAGRNLHLHWLPLPLAPSSPAQLEVHALACVDLVVKLRDGGLYVGTAALARDVMHTIRFAQYVINIIVYLLLHWDLFADRSIGICLLLNFGVNNY